MVDQALVEHQLQHALARLAAGPGMVLVDQFVIVDVADRERASVRRRSSILLTSSGVTAPNQRLGLSR